MGDNNSYFFEGVEKLLEVWFTREDGNIKNSECDLRKIPRHDVEKIIEMSKCTIISVTSSDSLDAYVLSESSMFISRRRFILKTCGKTTPLACLGLLINLSKQYTGLDSVEDVYYSRKNFRRPELQAGPHRRFDEEVQLLDQFFKDGAAYCLGKVNREDCWYLYTLNPIARDTVSHRVKVKEPDQTLELLMMDLDPDVMKVFTKEVSKSAAEATEKSGIDKLLPDVIIDDFLFDPCGYSMNGILKNGCYMTIHITPEPQFSYVSFESNIPHSSDMDVIGRVLSCFKPDKFIMTVFANESSEVNSWVRDLEVRSSGIDEYVPQDVQYCRIKNYDMVYSHYTRFPS